MVPLSLPAPGTSGTFPRHPLPATCADSLHKVGPLLLRAGKSPFPSPHVGLAVGAAPRWRVAFTTAAATPERDLCASPTASRPSQRTDSFSSLQTSTVANLHIRRVLWSVQGLRNLPTAQITTSCRKDGSGWEEVGLGQVTVFPTSSCGAGSWSHTQLKEAIPLRGGDIWPLTSKAAVLSVNLKPAL